MQWPGCAFAALQCSQATAKPGNSGTYSHQNAAIPGHTADTSGNFWQFPANEGQELHRPRGHSAREGDRFAGELQLHQDGPGARGRDPGGAGNLVQRHGVGAQRFAHAGKL
jgi:hypothetical protein